MLKNDSDRSFEGDIFSICGIQFGVLNRRILLPATNAEDNQAYSSSVEKKDRRYGMTIDYARISNSCLCFSRRRTSAIFIGKKIRNLLSSAELLVLAST
jgi:hypothetical protein